MLVFPAHDPSLFSIDPPRRPVPDRHNRRARSIRGFPRTLYRHIITYIHRYMHILLLLRVCTLITNLFIYHLPRFFFTTTFIVPEYSEKSTRGRWTRKQKSKKSDCSATAAAAVASYFLTLARTCVPGTPEITNRGRGYARVPRESKGLNNTGENNNNKKKKIVRKYVRFKCFSCVYRGDKK